MLKNFVTRTSRIKCKFDKYFPPLYENLEDIQVIVLGRQVDWGPSRPVLFVHNLEKAASEVFWTIFFLSDLAMQ